MNLEILDSLYNAALIIIGFVVVYTFCGFIEALFAYICGDKTSRFEGFLSLNPAVHMNPAGLIIAGLCMIVTDIFVPGAFSQQYYILSLVLFGERIVNRVPVESSYFRNLTWGLIMHFLAQSIACFLLALIFLYVRAIAILCLGGDTLMMMIPIINTCIYMAVWFGVMELIPMPPFRGGRALMVLLPASVGDSLRVVEENSLYVLLILFILPGVSTLFYTVLGSVSQLVILGLQCLVLL